MPLRQLLIRRLMSWLGVWFLLCLAILLVMGQRDVKREYDSAQAMVGELHQLLMRNQPLSQSDLAAAQASLAQSKAHLEDKETRRELLVVGGMLLLMAMGSGAVVWFGLRPVLNRPLEKLVSQLKDYENGHREPPKLHTEPKTIQATELAEIADSITQLIHTLHEEQKRSSELLHKVLHLQEQERQIIAQDLHDHFGQLLTSISVNSAFLSKRTEGAALECSQAIHLQSQEMMHWLRGSLRELKPHLLLEVSVRDAALDLLESWARRSGWFVDFAWAESITHLSEQESIVVFRILQEALTNAARHSKAKRVEVLAGIDKSTDELVLLVNNDGVTSKEPIKASLGLTGLQERAHSLGGQAQWRTQAQRFELTCRIPLKHTLQGQA